MEKIKLETMGANETELLTTFATDHRLRIQRDECGDLIIPSPLGNLYQYSSIELGLMVLPPSSSHPRLWNSIREKCLAAGMTLRQNGDTEGSVSFDPTNQDQAKLAIKLAKVRPKWQMSPERREAQLVVLANARKAKQNSIRKGTSEPSFASGQQGTGESMAVSELTHETPVLIEERSNHEG